jgi:hypothetical protein
MFELLSCTADQGLLMLSGALFGFELESTR